MLVILSPSPINFNYTREPFLFKLNLIDHSLYIPESIAAQSCSRAVQGYSGGRDVNC